MLTVWSTERSFDGRHFETGQGSAVANGTAEGVAMVTLEARATVSMYSPGSTASEGIAEG